MANQSKRRWVILGALVLLMLCLCATGVIVVGAGFFLFNSRTATPPVTRVPTIPVPITRAPTLGTSTPSARPKPTIALPQDQATCLAQGGRWGRIGISPREQCNLPAPDAGQVCNDSSECAGLCLANLSKEEQERVARQRVAIQTSGKCSNWVIVVGCVAIVENGQVKNILCID